MLNAVKSRTTAKKIVLLSFAFASLYANAQKVNLEVGKSFKVTTVSDGVTEMMGNDNPNKVNATATVKITGLEKDLYKGTNTVTKITMSGSMMGQEFTFDSDKKEDMNGQLGQMVGADVNKAIDFTVDKNTGVFKVTGEVKEGGMGAMMGGGKSGGSSIFYSAVIGKKQGEKWTETKDEEGVKTTMNYEVVSINGNVVSLNFSSTTKGNTTSEMQGQSVDVVVDSKTTGTITVDAVTGIMKQSTMNVEASTSMDMGGQSMTMGNKSKVITTVE
jgi:hypothetical protein